MSQITDTAKQVHHGAVDNAICRADLPTIHELMPRLLAAIRPVGKDGRNTQQNYSFRSVDGIYDAIHRAEAEVGVFHLPEVLQRTVDNLPTKGGGHQRLVTIEAVYRFYGPRGDCVTLGPVWGEGSDVGDKATSKAQTATLKYGLIHALCIPLVWVEDADAHHVEFAAPEPPKADAPTHTAIRTAIEALSSENKEKVKAWWKEASLPPISKADRLSEAQADTALAFIESLEEDPIEIPDEEDGDRLHDVPLLNDADGRRPF